MWRVCVRVLTHAKKTKSLRKIVAQAQRRWNVGATSRGWLRRQSDIVSSPARAFVCVRKSRGANTRTSVQVRAQEPPRTDSVTVRHDTAVCSGVAHTSARVRVPSALTGEHAVAALAART
jgi:hypothetical protein